HDALRRRADDAGENDPEVVERRGQRQDLEVCDRDDAILVGDDERVRLRGVELDREDAVAMGERVAGGPVEARQVAERQGVLEVARGTRSEQVAAVEELPESSKRGGEAGVGPDL